MSKAHELLKKENSCLNDMIIDSQAHSMRDNLLFFGIEDCPTAQGRIEEDCTSKILHFCNDKLGIIAAAENIKIDRSHRIGRYKVGSARPIVAKFCFFQDKLSVKRSAYDKLKNSTFRVSDQFPQAVREKRAILKPYLDKAKKDGKSANLSFDKLIINGKSYTVDTILKNCGKCIGFDLGTTVLFINGMFRVFPQS